MTFKENLLEYLDKEFVEKLLNSMTKERTNSLILNTNKMSCEEFEKMFPKIQKNSIINNAYYFDKKDYDFGKTFYFDNGLFYIQDSASMLVSFLLPINDDDYVLDMCAAPGGKSIFLSLKNNKINLLSNDQNYNRALVLSSNIERIGLKNVIVSSITTNILEKHYKNTFDKIILDAPCSGSAMFRKNEEMKNDWNYNKIIKCSEIQNELLEQASMMLKDGGIISYSTCSFSYEENEKVIINFLEKHHEFSLIKLPTNSSFYRTKELPEAIHIFPCLFDGEGQFICQLKKAGKSIVNKPKNEVKINEYGFKYKQRIDDRLYVYNSDLDFNNIPIIRKGLHVGTYKGDLLIPSFHYAHYLDSLDSIKLDSNEVKKYIHGDEISKDLPKETGFYPVSFNGINLGYVHYVNGKLKNLYPKGMRH